MSSSKSNQSENRINEVDWTSWLRGQRRRAVNLILAAAAAVGIFGVGYSLLLLIVEGRTVNFIPYAITFVLILALILLTRMYSEKIGRIGFLVLLYAFSIFSLYSGWLASSGRLFLVVLVVSATLLFNPRSGFLAAGISLITYVAFAAAYDLDWLKLRELPDPTTISPIIIEGVGFVIVLAIVVINQWFFGQALKASSQANLQAQQSKESFHNIVEHSADGIVVLTREGAVMFVNQAAERFFKTPRAEWIGKPSQIIPVSKERAEIPIWRQDDREGMADIRLDETEWEDKPAYLASLRDVTDRKQAQLALQQANADLQEAYDKTIEGWARALDLRDRETEGHTQRVTQLTVKLARVIGLSDDEIVHIRRGALLHDIGKMGIPDEILQKPGPLTEKEWEIMRCHPVYARQFLVPIKFLDKVMIVPYFHHEHWDGSGYPEGLKGVQIPLSARLFSIVDVWDALNSDRPYRKKLPREDVVAYLHEQAGILFEPELVEKFLFLPELKNYETYVETSAEQGEV